MNAPTTPSSSLPETYQTADSFRDRHIGPDLTERQRMLNALGCKSLDELIEKTIPAAIRMDGKMDLPNAASEAEALAHLQAIADQNIQTNCFRGQGYYPCITPKVILRNILENPQWYTPYTPYQAEVAQGRLELLLNFQTLVTDLTGLDMANASLLDESTAAAEAMTVCHRLLKRKDERKVFFIGDDVHSQTIAVIRNRAEPLGLRVVVGDALSSDLPADCFGALVQYPSTRGDIACYQDLADRLHESGARLVVASDLLALCLLKPPADWGADMVVGTTQRLGMPMGFGGPHAAFFACREECQRQLPGRIVGISKDREGNPAYRLSLQTREQHIRRDKATSNICTAQALPAMVAAAYAIYHGPARLRQIAMNVHLLTTAAAQKIKAAGYEVNESCFDTLCISGGASDANTLKNTAAKAGIDFRVDAGKVILSFDETKTLADLNDLLAVFGAETYADTNSLQTISSSIPADFCREGDILGQPVFNQYQSETKMMRYLDMLQQRDLGLTDSMIPLGSCTMKLNAAAEMTPVTWPGFANMHPFAPADQCLGYKSLQDNLERWLCEVTGFAAVSLQPNAGSQGEYAGLLAIRGYHRARGDEQRNICLIPMSAHGTNPASAVMAGMKVIGVKCDDEGNIDIDHLKQQAETHKDVLAALMVTYPSTHGVFEEGIKEICQVVHDAGGQVYLDGANMNAMVGLCRPGDIGGDVCHLNLHKTFCIPHGGGGPGMGPIGVAEHLTPYLPGHPERAVSASALGSGCILPISYAYILMMGTEGLELATKTAILNANYIAHRLQDSFPVLYRGKEGFVAHECIVDCRHLKQLADIEIDDIAKRLMDFGFHAPTMSWPVAGTLMIEPTESEALDELDRFCDAMIQIRREIQAVEDGKAKADDNPLKHAPHTAQMIASDSWSHAYSRNEAAFALPWLATHKYWPPVARVDNVFGDRNLVCTCDPVSAYAED